jgi:hypothetical protein
LPIDPSNPLSPSGRFHRATSHIAGRFNAKGREHKGQKHEAGKQTHFGDSESSLEGVEETSVFVPSAGVEVLVAGEVIRFSLVVGFEEAQPGEEMSDRKRSGGTV